MNGPVRGEDEDLVGDEDDVPVRGEDEGWHR